MAQAVRQAEATAASERLQLGASQELARAAKRERDRELNALQKFKEDLTAFEKRLPSIAGGASARRLHAEHQEKTSQPGRTGVGYGVEWPGQAATDLMFGYTPDPKKPNPKKDQEWESYRQRVEASEKKKKVAEVSCLTVMENSLPPYVSGLGVNESRLKQFELNQSLKEALAKAVDARGPGVTGAPEVYGGRATVLLEELRKRFGFRTVHIDALSPGAEDKYWNKENYTSHADALRTHTVPYKKSDVKGKDTNDVIDTRVRIDDFLVLNEKMNKKSRDAWAAIQRAEYAVGVADSGYHTFVISGGMVYEVHWDRSESDPKLTEASPLRDFFKNRGGDWGSGVIALPPSAEAAASAPKPNNPPAKQRR
jgi:hypothetical protein